MDGKEFLQALENITKEKGIDKSVVLEAMEAALNAAYKKNFNSLTNSRVTIDEHTGEIKVFSCKTVVEEIENEKTEITLEEALETLLYSNLYTNVFFMYLLNKNIQKYNLLEDKTVITTENETLKYIIQKSKKIKK